MTKIIFKGIRGIDFPLKKDQMGLFGDQPGVQQPGKIKQKSGNTLGTDVKGRHHWRRFMNDHPGDEDEDLFTGAGEMHPMMNDKPLRSFLYAMGHTDDTKLNQKLVDMREHRTEGPEHQELRGHINQYHAHHWAGDREKAKAAAEQEKLTLNDEEKELLRNHMGSEPVSLPDISMILGYQQVAGHKGALTAEAKQKNAENRKIVLEKLRKLEAHGWIESLTPSGQHWAMTPEGARRLMKKSLGAISFRRYLQCMWIARPWNQK